MLWKLNPGVMANENRSFEFTSAVSLCDLEVAKVRLLYEKLWQPVLGSVIISVLLSIIVWPHCDPLSIVLWVSALTVLSGLRLWLAYRFQCAPFDHYHRKWLYTFAFGALLSGILWGVAGVLFFTPSNPSQIAALAIVLAGVAAGGTTTLSSVRWVGLGFISPVLLPLSAMFFIQGSQLSILMGVIVLVFVALMLATCIRFHRIIHDNIALRVSIQARETQLMESENRYRSIFDHSPLGVVHFDRQGTITDCNEQMLAILGAEREALIDYRMLSCHADPDVAQGVREALEKGSGYFEGTFYLPGAETGTPLRAIFNRVNSAVNERVGGVAIVEDFTERTRNEAIIYRQAYYDALTDLPNRRLFIERLMGLASEPSSCQRTGVILFLDLDRFKRINDTFGHAAGDDLLVQVAGRLEKHLSEGDMAARLSGDEFVMLKLFDQPFDETAERAAGISMSALQQVLTGHYHLGSQRVEVTPSMGYTCFSVSEYDHAEILKQADIAMYQAKADGRARLRRYRHAMRKVLSDCEPVTGLATSLTDH